MRTRQPEAGSGCCRGHDAKPPTKDFSTFATAKVLPSLLASFLRLIAAFVRSFFPLRVSGILRTQKSPARAFAIRRPLDGFAVLVVVVATVSGGVLRALG